MEEGPGRRSLECAEHNLPRDVEYIIVGAVPSRVLRNEKGRAGNPEIHHI